MSDNSNWGGDPIVIDPPGFDIGAAWKECSDFVKQCGGLQHADGETNWRAASGADPGCCSCPACGMMYWAWGSVQQCKKCGFQYPTDWWPMYSWGSQAASRTGRYQHDARMSHFYYRYGFEHPAKDPWDECHTESWRKEIRSAQQQEHKR